MSKADRLDTIEAKLDEIIQLLRALVISDLTSPKEPTQPYIAPVNPYVPPVMPADPGQPWSPPTVPNVPHLDPVNTCSKCGMQFGSVTGYSCPQPDCPKGLGPITC